MRLVGPDCFGVAVPGIGLDATFAARPARAGVAGLVMQSGGLGFAMVDHLSRLGIGISSFASVGDKLDVSGNDMLLWWEHDGLTRLAVLYIESFGNPRKFARTARRVSCTMPVLTVQAEPAAHPEALFEQAGVITTRGFGELVEATALLATQPVPAGRTVAIVSNVGSAGALAADACAGLGLTVHHPHGQARRRLRTLIPGAVTGPVDTTAPVSAEDFRQCLELLAADDEVDAIVAIVLPTGATGDLEAAIPQADVGEAARRRGADQPESVRLLAGRTGCRPTGPGGRGAGPGPRGRLRRLAGRAARPGARLPRHQDRGRPRPGARVLPPGLARPGPGRRAAALLRDLRWPTSPRRRAPR